MTPVTSASTANAAPQATNGSTAASSSVDKLANENTFLQLFTAQLKNQNPLSPADGTQFVSQLAQFSELEQVINIGQNVSAIRQGVTGSSGSGASAAGQSAVKGSNQVSGS